jgi:hypothetical protein
VTLRARWVTLRARWVTLRARWVTLRARWVTLRALGAMQIIPSRQFVLNCGGHIAGACAGGSATGLYQFIKEVRHPASPPRRLVSGPSAHRTPAPTRACAGGVHPLRVVPVVRGVLD